MSQCIACSLLGSTWDPLVQGFNKNEKGEYVDTLSTLKNDTELLKNALDSDHYKKTIQKCKCHRIWKEEKGKVVCCPGFFTVDGNKSMNNSIRSICPIPDCEQFWVYKKAVKKDARVNTIKEHITMCLARYRKKFGQSPAKSSGTN